MPGLHNLGAGLAGRRGKTGRMARKVYRRQAAGKGTERAQKRLGRRVGRQVKAGGLSGGGHGKQVKRGYRRMGR